MSSREFRWPLARVGIIGGGQLGRMMTKKAKKLGCYVIILDPYPNSPAGQVAGEQIIGEFMDPAKIELMAERSDVITYDIEHVDTATLKQLAARGAKVFPSPELLETIQDKFKQKEMLVAHGLPTPEFKDVGIPTLETLREFGFPLVQKARRGGYDGRGVAVIRSEQDFAKILRTDSYLERMVDLDREIAVMVARRASGEIRAFPAVEMVVDADANLLDLLLAPARAPESVQKEAQELAIRTVDAIKGVGIFGIEMFLDKAGNLFLNEIAPRPHNSGHYTMEACLTCQFEQHFRAILDLPLGATDMMRPAAMINLLGEPGPSGPALIQGLEEAMAVEGASIHIYGKAECTPFRKMGHVTVLDQNLDRALDKVLQIREILKIRGGTN